MPTSGDSKRGQPALDRIISMAATGMSRSIITE
jgi:hypothetical protein